MLHANFKILGLRVPEKKNKILNVFTIYGHGGHLGHMIVTTLCKLSFPLPRDDPH